LNQFVNDPNGKYRVAVISDTHGLLRAAALKQINGADLIIHAGDVGDASILDQLNAIAPVYAVRGNTDCGDVVSELPFFDCIKVADLLVCVIHDLHTLDIDIASADVNLVISGHTHQPEGVEHNNVLFLNPGSIGPRRFDYPISMALLDVEKQHCSMRFVELND